MAEITVQEQPQAPAPAPEVKAEDPKPEPKAEANPVEAQSDPSKGSGGGGEGEGHPRDEGQAGDSQGQSQGQDNGEGQAEDESQGDGVDTGPKKQETAKAAPENRVDTKSQGDEDGDEDGDDPHAEMRDGIGGGMTGWAGKEEEGPAGGEGDDANGETANLESAQDDGPSFAELSGGLGAGLLGLNVPTDEDGQADGNAETDSARPAISRKGRRANATKDDEEVTAAARKLGHRGGVKSGQARRVRSIKLKKPEMQAVSQGQERQPRQKRPQWFNPPRLPGMKG